MPADRLFHPRAGLSKKISALSDLEFRVWWTYQLAADDYGVMPRSAIAIQAANKALVKHAARVIDAALTALVKIGLVLTFEHQDESYLCQRDWQEFQKVRYPRDTLMPAPTPEIFLKCSEETQELFRKHPRNISGEFPPARTRETASGSPASGNGIRQEANGLEDSDLARVRARANFDTFWTAYPNKTRRADAETAWAKLGPDSALVDKMLAAIETQRQSTQWTRESGRFIPNPAKWLGEQRWRDEGTAAQPAVVSTVTRQNRANADEAKRLMRARHGRQ